MAKDYEDLKQWFARYPNGLKLGTVTQYYDAIPWGTTWVVSPVPGYTATVADYNEIKPLIDFIRTYGFTFNVLDWGSDRKEIYIREYDENGQWVSYNKNGVDPMEKKDPQSPYNQKTGTIIRDESSINPLREFEKLIFDNIYVELFDGANSTGYASSRNTDTKTMNNVYKKMIDTYLSGYNYTSIHDSDAMKWLKSNFYITRLCYRFSDIETGEPFEFPCDRGDYFVYTQGAQKYFNYKDNGSKHEDDTGWFWEQSIPKALIENVGLDPNNPNSATNILEMIQGIQDYNKDGSKHYKILQPFIIRVTDHWFYKEMDFSKCYTWIPLGEAKAIVTPYEIGANSDIDSLTGVQLLAENNRLMVRSVVEGYLYQFAEPVITGQGEFIKWLIGMTENGSMVDYEWINSNLDLKEIIKEVAPDIEPRLNRVGKETGITDRYFITYDGDVKKTEEQLTEKKYKQPISFDNSAIDAIAMLEQIGGKDSQMIIRMFKELLESVFDIVFVTSSKKEETQDWIMECVRDFVKDREDLLPDGNQTVIRAKIPAGPDAGQGFSWVDENAGFEPGQNVYAPKDAKVAFRSDDAVTLRIINKDGKEWTMMITGLRVDDKITLDMDVTRSTVLGKTASFYDDKGNILPMVSTDLSFSFRDENKNSVVHRNKMMKIRRDENGLIMTDADGNILYDEIEINDTGKEDLYLKDGEKGSVYVYE